MTEPESDESIGEPCLLELTPAGALALALAREDLARVTAERDRLISIWIKDRGYGWYTVTRGTTLEWFDNREGAVAMVRREAGLDAEPFRSPES